MDLNIRWHQRFSSYRKALDRFKNNVAYIQNLFPHMDLDHQNIYNGIALGMEDIVKHGLIHSFEFTHELAWKTLKDYAEYQGRTDITGCRDAVRFAANVNLIADGQIWMDMIASRNRTSHTYNEETANEIFKNIITQYAPLFDSLNLTLENLRSCETGTSF